MVLYLFVIMLLNLGHTPGFRWWRNWRTYVGFALTGIMCVAALHRARYEIMPMQRGFSVNQVRDVARLMFQNPLLLFLVEALSVLLLIAVVGAIHLGRRYSADEKAEMDRQIAESGVQPREGTA
jgi:NADH:ubiquinone oxidoreductase subunit 6 (subunit J)